MSHNVENPVTFEQARKEFNCSEYYMTALKKACGIKTRVFMLSAIRNFLRDNPQWKTTDVYPNHRKPGRAMYLKIQPDGKRWVVSMASCPDVMAEDKSISKALAVAAEQLEKFQRAA